MKIISWIKENILFVLTLFLLAFIPLYPKLPLIGVTHTWVYIRLEDFLIALAVIIFGIQLLRKKATLKTPLTLPIFLFWGVGLVSTVFAVLVIFPTLINVFPKLAFFNYLRRIEYISLFFLAFSSIKDKKYIYPIVITLTLTLLAVVGYGMGQRFLGFPAYLTMNEEFAKGIPLRLSQAARIPSTFAGHYDLAAYLVMLIPIMGSMVFGFKKIYMKLLMAVAAFLGLILLLMTASRTSFLVYIVVIAFMLILQKKKWFIIPVFIISIITLQSFQGISQRFSSTISSADVVYDARTGKAIGIASEDNDGTGKKIVIKDIQSTGENLPQGSSYINLPTQQQTTSTKNITYKRSLLKDGTESTEIKNVEGDFIVRKALAYDVSFTTRFQGEWPRAYEAFKRNILLGSGYSTISLATDGNYIRILGEVGILGFISFFLIFLFISIYAAKILPDVDSKFTKSFIYGVLAAILGLGLNAVLIDVFEASKVAYVLWLLVGVTVGLLHLYQKEKINFAYEVKRVLLSFPAIMIYILIAAFIIFAMAINNFFVGDDFTWLRWIADCPKVLGTDFCLPSKDVIIRFFTDSQGFFYRPGTKMYFFFLYAIAWFTPFFYHVFSVLTHAFVTMLVFILATRILKSKLFGTICAVLFLVLSIHFEAIFWISSIGHLVTPFFMLTSILFFSFWLERKHWALLAISLIAAFIAPLFHESGAFLPLLLIGYDLSQREVTIPLLKKRWYYLLFLLQIPVYWLLRLSAQSAWFQGDYSYNLVKLPFNIIGNLLGYIALTFTGVNSINLISNFREYGQEHTGLIILLIILGLVLLGIGGKFVYKKLTTDDKRIVATGVVFYVIPLLPFLGLGNISPRYVYLGSFGLLLLFSFGLQKIWLMAYKKQRIFSYLLLLILVPFVMWNIGDLQRINTDWTKAGDITNNMMVNIGKKYKSSKVLLLPQNSTFYFVNTPIRLGEAWVFPVGLPDAIWFVFQQEHVNVKQSASVEQAIEQAKGVRGAKIFHFTTHGEIEEITAL